MEVSREFYSDYLKRCNELLLPKLEEMMNEFSKHELEFVVIGSACREVLVKDIHDAIKLIKDGKPISGLQWKLYYIMYENFSKIKISETYRNKKGMLGYRIRTAFEIAMIDSVNTLKGDE